MKKAMLYALERSDSLAKGLGQFKKLKLFFAIDNH